VRPFCHSCFYHFPCPRFTAINRYTLLPFMKSFGKRVHIDNGGGSDELLTMCLHGGGRGGGSAGLSGIMGHCWVLSCLCYSCILCPQVAGPTWSGLLPRLQGGWFDAMLLGLANMHRSIVMSYSGGFCFLGPHCGSRTPFLGWAWLAEGGS